ncbi:MAG: TlpA family protein disulfide reductase [Kiritimatiellae bacterium]|jgi:thiol-disulfide isomerase/thioredoxin|nr:TlpA family protein disulfide reductase [Kiritimatiellia bacterium]
MLIRVAFSLISFSAMASGATNLVGSVAASPVFTTLDGRYVAISQYYAPATNGPACESENVVLLDFMSLTCAPCKKELPVFLETVREAVRKAPKNRKVQSFVVSLDPLSAKERLRDFMVQHNVNLESELLLDPYHKAAAKFNVTSIPRTFVISGKGIIVCDIEGATEQYKEQLERGINAALGGIEPSL